MCRLPRMAMIQDSKDSCDATIMTHLRSLNLFLQRDLILVSLIVNLDHVSSTVAPYELFARTLSNIRIHLVTAHNELGITLMNIQMSHFTKPHGKLFHFTT